ncbi:MAG: hypoxanthine phosphoribosyltransferase [Cryomorphaceae bacterium]|jgi:hypoxanthine phosphoribosyltransferase
MEKHFISANDLLIDSFQLAEKIFLSGYKPDFIIGVWRGGAPVGIAIQEYLDFMGMPTDHIAIRTSSYTGIDQQEKTVRVHGLDYIIDNVNADDEVLLVDDVFDSGRSIKAIFERMQKKTRANMPKSIKIACPWYKPSRNSTDFEPDFYVHETDKWLVFPHELNGLTLEEISTGKPKLAETILKHASERKIQD